jgi:putative acetyltransferase
MVIRDEMPDDRAGVRVVIIAAFGRPEEAALVDALRTDGDAVLSLVADDDRVIVGHMMLSRMKAPFRALGLAPASVMPERQRAGIGGMLVCEGLARATSAGWDAVFVLGEPDYYKRFGFLANTAAGFACRYAGPHFMALALHPSGMPVQSGGVAYPPAFGPS